MTQRAGPTTHVGVPIRALAIPLPIQLTVNMLDDGLLRALPPVWETWMMFLVLASVWPILVVVALRQVNQWMEDFFLSLPLK